MASTLAQLRTRLDVLWDVSGSGVLTSPEKNQLINDGYRALWAEVTAVNKTFRVSVLSFTLAAGTQTRALPSTFREVLTVRRDPGLDTQRFLNRYGKRQAAAMYEHSYRIEGTNLVIEPLSRCEGNYALDYVPNVTALAADLDEIDAELDQFQDFIVWFAVVEALAREESDISAFLILLNGTPDGREPGARGRVRRWASDQRSADPDVVEDVKASRRLRWRLP